MAVESERVVYNPLMFGGNPATGADGLGFGGGGLLGGLILGTLLRGGGLFGNGVGGAAVASDVVAGDIAAKVVALQNTTNIIDAIGTLGNEIQVGLNANNMNNSNNFRALDNQICGINQNLANLNYASTIQGLQNTQSIKDQATANQIIAAENACAIKGLVQAEADATRSLVHAETDRIIGLMNQTKIDDLREQLELERRGRQNREVEINIQNTATATQAQQQNQFQQQQMQFAQFANLVSDQLSKQTNSMINLGTMTGNAQTATNAQTKVNS